MRRDIIRQASDVDVALLLEGTYPLVSGGVSSWVAQLLEAMPEYRFACIFLGSDPNEYKQGLQYTLPDNVVHLELNYIFSDLHRDDKARPYQESQQAVDVNKSFHQCLKNNNFEDVPDAITHLDFYFDEKNGLTEDGFLYGRGSWETICDMYKEHCTDPSFIDYFWTVRNMHLPIWRLASIAKTVPTVKFIHSVSTGYAGFLGTLLKRDRHVPFVLCEHGIYTKERRIDLLHSDWIVDHRHYLQRDATSISYLRQLWISFFASLGSMTYAEADPVVSLFSGYQQQQITDGADASKTQIIPNGVDIKRLSDLYQQRGPSIPKVMCLLGRVVPIKDIKTFIRSVSIVKQLIPDIQAWIVGPDDEDPDYARECRALVNTLDIADTVLFKGQQNIQDILPNVGVLVLTSISEGLPLVMLEGFAAGVPSVTTKVGACEELIKGKNEEDKALGSAGGLVNLGDPDAVAQAVHELLTDKAVWLAAQQAGLQRVLKYYDRDAIFSEYRSIYDAVSVDQREEA